MADSIPRRIRIPYWVWFLCATMLIAALCFGVRVDRLHSIIADVERAGFRVTIEAPDWVPASLESFRAIQIGDGNWLLWGRVVDVYSLIGAPCTDNELRLVAELNTVESLFFENADVTDSGLASLTKLKNLRHLQLRQSSNIGPRRISDSGLASLARLANLKTLQLPAAEITDAGLTRLKELPRLTALSLESKQITDAGLAHLASLTNLEMLGLDGTPLTDAGLVHLKGMRKLETLYLTDMPVTDIGLEHLHGLRSLQYLNFGDAKKGSCTSQGIARLKLAVPGLRTSAD